VATRAAEEGEEEMKRKAISTRTRFEVFKRDGFRCAYCGITPVDAVLHVDHIVPVANGGTNDPANLTTSCQPCNGGKSAVPLDHIALAPTSQRSAAELREQMEQVRAFLAAQQELIAAKRAVSDEVAAAWEAQIGPMSQEMYDRIEGLLREWPFEKVLEAITIVGRRHGTRGQPFNPYDATRQAKYFHGILRNWRSGKWGR
jgi:hypothetical protein